jgi:hypothetical protein
VGIQVMSTGGDDGGDSAEGGAAEDGGGPTPKTFRLSDGQLLRYQRSLDDVGTESSNDGTVTGDQDGAGGGAPAQPAASEGGPVGGTASKLDSGREERSVLLRAARRRDTLSGFARAYTAADVPALRAGFLATLAHDAPNLEAGAQIEECDALVSQGEGSATLPVLAGHGRFEGERSLLLGYLSPEDEAGPLTKFTFFVWPRGDCSIPTHSAFGKVRI